MRSSLHIQQVPIAGGAKLRVGKGSASTTRTGGGSPLRRGENLAYISATSLLFLSCSVSYIASHPTLCVLTAIGASSPPRQYGSTWIHLRSKPPVPCAWRLWWPRDALASLVPHSLPMRSPLAYHHIRSPSYSRSNGLAFAGAVPLAPFVQRSLTPSRPLAHYRIRSLRLAFADALPPASGFSHSLHGVRALLTQRIRFGGYSSAARSISSSRLRSTDSSLRSMS